MRNESYIDQNLQSSFENFLMNSGNISQQDATDQINQIQQNAMNLINSQDPEIQKRLSLIEEIDPQELNEELQYLMNELSTNSYSAQDQIEISNALFNIFGFNIELDSNDEVQINLVEPTIDELDYTDNNEDYQPNSDYLDDDFTEMDQMDFSNPNYSENYSEGTYNASNTQESNFSYDDFDSLTLNENNFETRAKAATNDNQKSSHKAKSLNDLDYDFDY